MSKVTFIHKGGREQVMAQRYADILQKVGRGTYLTRHMEAAQPVGAVLNNPHTGEGRDPRDVASDPGAVLCVEPGAPLAAAPAPDSGIDIDAMGADQLHALARERGVKVHHKAGADKVRAALREAAE